MKETRTTPLRPHSDDIVERYNRTVQNHLPIVIDEHQNK